MWNFRGSWGFLCRYYFFVNCFFVVRFHSSTLTLFIKVCFLVGEGIKLSRLQLIKEFQSKFLIVFDDFKGLQLFSTRMDSECQILAYCYNLYREVKGRITWSCRSILKLMNYARLSAPINDLHSIMIFSLPRVEFVGNVFLRRSCQIYVIN